MNESAIPAERLDGATPHLRRVLTLRDLLIYAVVIVQPIAPLPLFGIIQADSRGHVVLTLLVDMVAMTLTAVSYGRMAALYPSAGSAYTYVGRGLNPHLGFFAGWAMLLCYVMFPLINVIYVSVTLHRVFPFIPYILAAIFCAAAMTLLNLRGVRATTRVNWALFAAMSLVIAAFVVLAIRYLVRAAGWCGFFSPEVIYNPHTFDWHSLSTAAAFGILTYLGFDGATTLAEDVENPRRNLPLATVFVVLFTGALGAILVFLGARVWPDYRVFSNLETAFMDVCRRVGGVSMYRAMAAIFVVASFGTGLAAQVGAARLLFGMGREGVLPAGYFGRIDTTRNTAPFNIVLIGIIGFGGALAFSFEQGTDLLNFGAFLAFMSVNVVTFWHFYVVRQHGRDRHFLADALAPLLGLVSCLAVWWGLPRSAMILGTAWIIGGFVIAAMKTRGFKTRPVSINFEGGS